MRPPPLVLAARSLSLALLAFVCVAFFSAYAKPDPRPSSKSALKAPPKSEANADPPAEPSEPPPPDYPLQSWMKANAAAPITGGDLPALAGALDALAGFAPNVVPAADAGPKPKEYANWAAIARDGASAARGNRLEAVKATCRSCHAQYRAKYKSELRDRPIPPPPVWPIP